LHFKLATFAGLVVSLGGLLTLAVEMCRPSVEPDSVFRLNPNVVSTSLMCVVAGLLVAATTDYIPRHKPRWRRFDIAFLATLMVAILLPFVYALGSDSGALGKAADAAVFWIAMSLALSTTLKSLERPLMVVIVSAVVISLIVVQLHHGRAFPYRTPPLAEQEFLTLMSESDSELLLTDDLRKFVVEVDAQSGMAGWAPGTSLVALNWSWGAFVPFLLEAKVPSSLMLSILGYDKSVDLAAYYLESDESDFDFPGAWLSLTNPDLLSEAQVNEVMTILDLASERGLGSFPGSFECVWSIAGQQMWKPTGAVAMESSDWLIRSRECPQRGELSHLNVSHATGFVHSLGE